MKELAHEFCSETEPPSWLEPELTAAVTTISASIEGENGFPRREELRNRLSKLHDALSLVSRELRDPAIVNILYGIADGREVPYSETDFLADTIRSYVSEVILLLRAGRGADRHIVNANGLSAAAMCAFHVAFAWHGVHGDLPKHTRPEVHNLCQKLWQAAHQKATGERDRYRLGGGWKDHLRKVKHRIGVGDGPPRTDETMYLLWHTWERARQLRKINGK